ncbi:hypothetical protein KEM52_004772, partial [Ascosphaera acerosa]
MCEAAVQQTSTWIMVDPWEAMQKEYVPTAQVLDHFDREINDARGGVPVRREKSRRRHKEEGGRENEAGRSDDDDTNASTRPPPRRRVRIALLAGADLIQTMSTPGVWSEADLQHILGKYG